MANIRDRRDQDRSENGELEFQNQNSYLSEYRIGTLEYPEGLRQNPDLQHWVAFYINTRDKSIGGNKPSSSYTSSAAGDTNYVDKKEQDRVNLLNNSGSKLSQDALASTIPVVRENAGKLAGAITFITKIGTGSKIKDAVTASVLVGTTARVFAEATKNLNLPSFTSGSTSRLKDVITLHIEERPSVKYGVNYADTDMGLLTGLLVEGSAAATAGNLKGALPEMQARFIRSLLKVPVLNNITELATRERTNPFREVLFESVDYRTFNFRYRFFPKSFNESEKIKSIIDTFKIHMHPQLSEQKLFYLYPSEFDIEYMYGDKANPYLHKLARCALTDMSVEYGGEQFSTHSDGSPVEIGLTLTFRELEQMTSERVKNGY
jgi:hypothetical protein